MAAEAATATRDEHYDIVSVLYHTLQEADTLEQYIKDAEDNGDQTAADFFREVQADDRKNAQRAKQLLRHRIDQGQHR
ncbi:hypothetical protein [Actinomadura sp. 3N407]|uniref:hypothetical protein n=1 Tax=Actinomadura sp. 3N407 TaxID=3457423 RepID=UPI003FCDB5A9